MLTVSSQALSFTKTFTVEDSTTTSLCSSWNLTSKPINTSTLFACHHKALSSTTAAALQLAGARTSSERKELLKTFSEKLKSQSLHPRSVKRAWGKLSLVRRTISTAASCVPEVNQEKVNSAKFWCQSSSVDNFFSLRSFTDTCKGETRIWNLFPVNDLLRCFSGDGGSPLVCPIKDKSGHYYQAGITSYGVGCSETGTPGVYVNVAKFRNWIDEQLRLKNLQTNTYTI